jgi:hypothetical protein
MLRIALPAFFLALLPLAAQTGPDHALLLISIDGMRPDYVSAADRYSLKIPNQMRPIRRTA